MGRILVRRLALTVLVLWGITLVTFFLSRIVPGDPARLIAGPRAPAEAVERVRQEYGLDQPPWRQYLGYMAGILRGDLGRSYVTRQPVLRDLSRFFPATLELTLGTVLLATGLGFPLGVAAAAGKDRFPDYLGRFLAVGGLSVPSFWLALVLQLAFYSRLGWLPSAGRLDIGLDPPSALTGIYTVDALIAGRPDLFANAFLHLILPVSVLALAEMGILIRVVRTSMLEVLREDYIRTAYAKGLPRRLVLYRHALRNALLAPVTVLGLEIGLLMGGVVLVEAIFAWPGIGRYAATAIAASDYNAIMGTTVVAAVVYLLANLAADLLYAYLDPRIRYA